MTNETDRELLELAAKAAGEKAVWFENTEDGACMGIEVEPGNPLGFDRWNPLEDDGDAFRMAVTLLISVGGAFGNYWRVSHRDIEPITFHRGVDHRAATRRAIVRAAAEIGRSM